MNNLQHQMKIMNARHGTSTLLAQVISLLTTIDDNEYCMPLELFNGTSLGQHFRHIFDCYDCLIQGIKENQIDYTLRKRNRVLEQNTAEAKKQFERINESINLIKEHQTVEVVADFSVNATNESRPVFQSSVGRELMYAYDHAIHHMAIIKIGIQVTFPYIALDREMGFAPSTIRYQKNSNQPEDKG